MTEWNATGYDRISTLQQQMAAEALALVQFQGSEHVLDVGCGSGRITAALASRVPDGKVVGIDASSDMIDFATKAATQAHIVNLHYDVRDARHLQFHAEFDAVVSFNALHWIPEQQLALRSIHAALRPGGLAQLRLVPRAERKSLEDVLEETKHSPRWAQYFDGHPDPYLHLSESEFQDLARRCDFDVQQCQVNDKAWDFNSRNNFFRFGDVTFVAWTQRLPSELKPDFIHDTLDRYRETACTRAGEENLFRFYQMDVQLKHKASPRPNNSTDS